MGFWSWLFGLEKKEEFDKDVTEIVSPNMNTEVKEPEIVTRKPLYKPRPLSREDALFVQEMTSKARSPDPKITPFIDKTNPQDIERITNELKEKLIKKR